MHDELGLQRESLRNPGLVRQFAVIRGEDRAPHERYRRPGGGDVKLLTRSAPSVTFLEHQATNPLDDMRRVPVTSEASSAPVCRPTLSRFNPRSSSRQTSCLRRLRRGYAQSTILSASVGSARVNGTLSSRPMNGTTENSR